MAPLQNQLDTYPRVITGISDERNTCRGLRATNQLGVTRDMFQLV
jgi:hypothetical protein